MVGAVVQLFFSLPFLILAALVSSTEFSRIVRKNVQWEPKRIAATAQEKVVYKETWNEKMYFINVIYSMTASKKLPANKRKHDSSISG